MIEFSSPVTVDLTGYRNVTDLLASRVRSTPQHAAFDVPLPGGGWRQVSTAEFADEVVRIARGLMAAGLQPGDAVALMAATRYEWAVCDLAIWFAGGVVVPIYDTSASAQVVAMVADAAVTAAIAGDQCQFGILAESFRSLGRAPLGIWMMDADPAADLRALIAVGEAIDPAEVEVRRQVADLDSIATIVYTSGTTARPKGVNITHRNFVGQVLGVAAGYQEVVREDGNTVIFLPLAHVLARGLQLICLAKGMRIAHLSDPKQVVPTLPTLRPTFLVVVPRVLQKIDAVAARKAERFGLGWVWAAARRTAIEAGRFAERADAGSDAGAPWLNQLRRALFDRLFYARIRAQLGGRINYLLCGAASLDEELSLLYRGMGIPVVEGYGLTETTAPVTGNLPGAIRSGTVGVPLPGNTVRISDDGEVLTRGIGVFPGYRNPADNAEAFIDGFFRTGDLGTLDADGRLRLLGRAKDVIVTAGGKTVCPTTWEHAVEADPLVAHAVLVGEGKPYLGGLILLDPETVQAWAARHGSRTLASLRPTPGRPIQLDDAHLVAVVKRAVSAANQQLSRSEQVRRFTLLLTDLSEAGGVVTPTMKLKRAVFTNGVGDIIDGLYLGSGTPA